MIHTFVFMLLITAARATAQEHPWWDCDVEAGGRWPYKTTTLSQADEEYRQSNFTNCIYLGAALKFARKLPKLTCPVVYPDGSHGTLIISAFACPDPGKGPEQTRGPTFKNGVIDQWTVELLPPEEAPRYLPEFEYECEFGHKHTRRWGKKLNDTTCMVSGPGWLIATAGGLKKDGECFSDSQLLRKKDGFEYWGPWTGHVATSTEPTQAEAGLSGILDERGDR